MNAVDACNDEIDVSDVYVLDETGFINVKTGKKGRKGKTERKSVVTDSISTPNTFSVLQEIDSPVDEKKTKKNEKKEKKTVVIAAPVTPIEDVAPIDTVIPTETFFASVEPIETVFKTKKSDDSANLEKALIDGFANGSSHNNVNTSISGYDGETGKYTWVKISPQSYELIGLITERVKNHHDMYLDEPENKDRIKAFGQHLCLLAMIEYIVFAIENRKLKDSYEAVSLYESNLIGINMNNVLLNFSKNNKHGYGGTGLSEYIQEFTEIDARTGNQKKYRVIQIGGTMFKALQCLHSVTTKKSDDDRYIKLSQPIANLYGMTVSKLITVLIYRLYGLIYMDVSTGFGPLVVAGVSLDNREFPEIQKNEDGEQIIPFHGGHDSIAIIKKFSDNPLVNSLLGTTRVSTTIPSGTSSVSISVDQELFASSNGRSWSKPATQVVPFSAIVSQEEAISHTKTVSAVAKPSVSYDKDFLGSVIQKALMAKPTVAVAAPLPAAKPTVASPPLPVAKPTVAIAAKPTVASPPLPVAKPTVAIAAKPTVAVAAKPTVAIAAKPTITKTKPVVIDDDVIKSSINGYKIRRNIHGVPRVLDFKGESYPIIPPPKNENGAIVYVEIGGEPYGLHELNGGHDLIEV